MLGLLVALVPSALVDLFHIDLVAVYADGAIAAMTCDLNLVVSTISTAPAGVVWLLFVSFMTL